MTDHVVIPLPGIGTLVLTHEVYQAALCPIGAPRPTEEPQAVPELVTAKTLAATLSLPVSCIYEYAKAGRIPCVRAGKHVRFSPVAVLEALNATGDVTVGHS